MRDRIDLNRLLASVGMSVFVDHFADFANPALSTADVADLLPREYTPDSRRSRASTARRLIREGFATDALRKIAESERVDPRAAAVAREWLAGATIGTIPCQCGCGEPAQGQFRPGHDQRLRSALERRVGGLLALRDLVAAAEEYASGEESLSSFSDRIRRTFTLLR